ncbi:acyl-CoA dehydrogenase family protein [Tenggerimyces flavus]|uniref:Acyl-CoA dehydrogenase family protein n=1 Tax=Tenggerimyces flavus TaxID=1708749 RepID=A0ABV7Y8X6_9ACTN|nr:acyl-CoA dehydrogenase family protein [Tenggerimyces flavus]MBM7783762.1 alkylation response protein AidB-like acyl-CoA dehydrogenase [Tenggerimyces flavus]
MPVDRLLPTPEAHELIGLTREIVAAELAPRAAEAEAESRFPREVFSLLGKTGLLSLPYPEEYGGGGQPFEVYLQVLEEIAYGWLSVGVGTSVQSLSCYPLHTYGSDSQKAEHLSRLLAGDLLGAYCLSEPQAGSDVAAMTTRAALSGSSYVLNGTKAWITHGGEADFYTLFARTSSDRSSGISCFLLDAPLEGLSFGAPEHKMGMTASSTTQVHLDDVRVPASRLIGDEGVGMKIALAALDSGRLGISACAVGLAQAALDTAVSYASTRTQFGKALVEFQGLSFLLADMAALVQSARATYLDAARRRDAGLPFGTQAAIAKLVATDAAMKVTTDAVQVLGGYGYTRDYPVERYMREAKVLQIFEGTNQIQRVVIGRSLSR